MTEAVAALSIAAAYLIRDLRTPPFFGLGAITDLLAATLRFVMLTRSDHPAVADWALAQYHFLCTKQATYRSRWLLPWGGAKRLNDWSHHAGQLGGKVVEWHVGDVSDEWFAEDLKQWAPRSDGPSAVSENRR